MAQSKSNLNMNGNALQEAGFEVVTKLPTTGLFAGREVFYRGKKYVYNGERWLYPIRFHQIADDTLITEPGWYNIGYYDDNVNLYDCNFDGILTISSAYSSNRGTSAIIVITSSFNEICITQLSGYKTSVIPQIRIVRDSNTRFILQFRYATTSRNPVNITYTDYRSTNPYRNPFKPLFGKSDIEFEEAAIVKVFTLTNGVKTNYNVEGGSIIKTGGTATQMLMADGSTKDINGFATVATSGSYNDLTDKPTLFSGSYNDLTDKPTLATVATSGSYNDLTNKPTQLPNPNPILIKTAADGVSVSYDGSTSGAVILEAGDNAQVTATQDSDDMMTVKFGAVVPQTLPNPNALNITVLDSEGASLGPSIVYDGVDARYLKLTEGYGIRLSNSNLDNSHEVTINLKQIAGTTLLGNANGTTDIPQAITMTQLRTMLGSLTLNGISVTLGGNSSYTLPCFISVGGALYQVRITNNWLQIYRNGIWANLYYLLSSLPTECRYITDLSDPSWYDKSVTEYELDNSATEQLLRAGSSDNLANWLEAIVGAQQITFNSSVILSKNFNKGALDNIISNLKGKGYSVFVENDIDTILSSGNDWVISIKIKRFKNTYKAIIECYVAR